MLGYQVRHSWDYSYTMSHEKWINITLLKTIRQLAEMSVEASLVLLYLLYVGKQCWVTKSVTAGIIHIR